MQIDLGLVVALVALIVVIINAVPGQRVSRRDVMGLMESLHIENDKMAAQIKGLEVIVEEREKVISMMRIEMNKVLVDNRELHEEISKLNKIIYQKKSKA